MKKNWRYATAMSARENDYDGAKEGKKKRQPTRWHLHRYIPTRLYIIAIAIRAASIHGAVSAASLFAYKRIAISLSVFLFFFLFVNFRRRGDKSPHTCKNTGRSFSATLGMHLVCNTQYQGHRRTARNTARDNFRCLCVYYAPVFTYFFLCE